MRFYCWAILCFVIGLTFQASAQKISFSEKKSSYHTYIKGNNFEGVVFSDDFVFPFLENQSGDKRFTPSSADIEKTEQILINNLKSVNKLRLKQGGNYGPVIDENLNSYVRQYYGYFSDVGDKVVYISCLLKTNYKPLSKELPNWLKGAVVVLNGGSNYWQIQANLTTSTLFGLEVNGLEKEKVASR